MMENTIDTNRHAIFVGTTSSGKTWGATDLYITLRGINIFINSNYEPRVERHSTVVCETPTQVARALEMKIRHICFNPHEDAEIAKRQVIEIKKLLFCLGKEINTAGKRLIWCHLYIDELHEFSSKIDPCIEINNIFRKGLRHGVACIGISQSPADVAHIILKNCESHVIYKHTGYEEPYFKKYRFDMEPYEDWIKRDFHYVVYSVSNDAYTECRPVPKL